MSKRRMKFRSLLLCFLQSFISKMENEFFDGDLSTVFQTEEGGQVVEGNCCSKR